ARVSNWADGSAWRLITFSGNYGNASNQLGTNIFIFLGGASDAYIDDVSLVPLSGPFAGSNLIQNGDFEAPLNGTWAFAGAALSASELSSTYVHSGSNSLHLKSTGAGSLAVNMHQAQALPLMTTNIFCTLSFWYKPTASSNLTVRTFPGSLLSTNLSIRPVLITPGTNNSVTSTL